MDYYKNNDKFKNPIIRGFYPDPSICRVGEDYYLVNSSFEYFPAIPVWHSKDLVHWEQICNAINRKEQNLNLDEEVICSKGIQACTIRYHNGTYYIISTCLRKEWPHTNCHFIITAKDPKGPWSELHRIEGAGGIDSSLFFDDDGKAYFQANRDAIEPKFEGDTEIWAQEIDLENFKLIGESHALWKGCGGHYPEGPHIYKRNGYYYLLIAEGGTCHYHSVTLARSEHVFGPYTMMPRNPLLTHRHLHRTYPIQNVGHADIVETQNGEWYMVCLGSRPRGGFYNGGNTIYTYGGYYRNLGRETFLLPMVWEDDYGPICSPLTGRVEMEYELPNLPKHTFKALPSCIKFDNDKLDIRLCTVRNEGLDFFTLNKEDKVLRMKMSKDNINTYGDVSILGIRQTSWNYSASTNLRTRLDEEETTGISLYMNFETHARMFIEKEKNKLLLKVIKSDHAKEELLASLDITEREEDIRTRGLTLYIEQDTEDVKFYYGFNSSEAIEVCNLDARYLSTDLAGGHTGCFIMLFANSNNKESLNHVDFDYLEFKELD